MLPKAIGHRGEQLLRWARFLLEKPVDMALVDRGDRRLKVRVRLRIKRTVSGACSRTLARNCAPFMVGIRMSEITSANGPDSLSRRKPSAPPIAVCTSSCLRSVRWIASSTFWSSSTNSTRSLMPRSLTPAPARRRWHRGQPTIAADDSRARVSSNPASMPSSSGPAMAREDCAPIDWQCEPVSSNRNRGLRDGQARGATPQPRRSGLGIPTGRADIRQLPGDVLPMSAARSGVPSSASAAAGAPRVANTTLPTS